MPAGTLPNGRPRFSCPLAQPVNSASAARPSRDAISSSTRSSAPERSRAANARFNPSKSTWARPATRASRSSSRSSTTDLRSKTWASADNTASRGDMGAAGAGRPSAAATVARNCGSSAPASFNHPVRRSTAVAWVFASRLSPVMACSASWVVAPTALARSRIVRRRLLNRSRSSAGTPLRLKPSPRIVSTL